MQTITLAESAPHKDGPGQALEGSLPTAENQVLGLQEFAESIAKLIQQVPVVREAALITKTENEKRKEAEEAVSIFLFYVLSYAKAYISTSRE